MPTTPLMRLPDKITLALSGTIMSRPAVGWNEIWVNGWLRSGGG